MAIMGVRSFNVYALLCLIGFSIFFISTMLSGDRVDNTVVDADLTNLENQMLKEERRGYNIEIRSSSPSERTTTIVFSEGVTPEGEDGSEVLLIDGKVVPYLKTSEGYRIYYQPPAPDLPSAARIYVDTQPEK